MHCPFLLWFASYFLPNGSVGVIARTWFILASSPDILFTSFTERMPFFLGIRLPVGYSRSTAAFAAIGSFGFTVEHAESDESVNKDNALKIIFFMFLFPKCGFIFADNFILHNRLYGKN